MAETREERRLAAILAADMVGYSRLMEADERGTVARQKAHRAELMDPCIADHNGRIVKSTGDGLLVEFASVVDAVECAVEVQRGMADREIYVPDDRRIQYRVGINLGDIIIDDDDILGEGVNVAARLEGLAEPGDICISRAARDQIRNKLDLALEDMGEIEVKNITRPIRVFRIAISEPHADQTTTTGEPNGGLQLPDKPSLAVLPFDNLSADPEQDYFSDGISEDIITALSRFGELFVIARNSSFSYRGTSVDIRQVGRDLGVRYVLEGSVRRAADRVRITAQLIEAETGNHIWAERYDRQIDDVFAVQDEITERVSGAVGGEIYMAETDRALERDKRDLGARELVMRAQWHSNRITEEWFVEARRLCESATQQFPNYAAGYSVLAFITFGEIFWGWGSPERSPADAAREAAEAAWAAIAIDANDEVAHVYLAYILWMGGRHGEALHEAEEAIRLNPNNSGAIACLGAVCAWSGVDSYERAVECLDQAIRLSPRDHFLHYWLGHRAFAEFFSGNYEAAIDWSRRSLHRNPNYSTALRCLISACANNGDIEQAQTAREQLDKVEPAMTIEKIRARVGQMFRVEDDFECYAEGLRMAGVADR